MLIAERLTKVYGRTDGGPGKSVSFDGNAFQSLNAPNPDTPCKWWNMVRFMPIMRGKPAYSILCAHQTITL